MGICCCKKFFQSESSKTTNESNNSNNSSDFSNSSDSSDSLTYYQSTYDYKKLDENMTNTNTYTTTSLQSEKLDCDKPIPEDTQKTINDFLDKKYKDYKYKSTLKNSVDKSSNHNKRMYFKELANMTKEFKSLLKNLIKTKMISIFLCNCILATCEDPSSDNQDFSMDTLLINLLPLMIDTNTIPDNLSDLKQFIQENEKYNILNIRIAKMYYKANIFNLKNKRISLEKTDLPSLKNEIPDLDNNIKTNDKMLELLNELFKKLSENV